MKENLAAINVICEGKIINRQGIPLLFYWDGLSEIIDDIQRSIDFKQWLEDEEILTYIKYYLNSSVSLFYFRSNDDDYQDATIPIQDLYSVNELAELRTSLLTECVYYLFNKSFPTDKPLIHGLTAEEQCKNAIYKILEKYTGKLSIESCINAIRAYIQENYSNFKHLDLFIEYVDSVIFNKITN